MTATNFLQAFNDQVAAIEELTLAVKSLTAATQSQDMCCAAEGTSYYPEPWDPEANPETSTFCDRAHSIVQNWEDAAIELFQKAIAGDELGLGLLVIITAALSLPLTILVALVTVVATYILETEEETIYDGIRALYDDLVCIIYLADDAETAKAAIDIRIETQGDSYNFGPSGEKLLKDLFGPDALNAVFLETYPIRADKVSSTCECINCADHLILTTPDNPYNVLLCGDYVTVGQSQSPDYGWESDQDSYTKIYFTPTEAVSQISYDIWVWSNHPSSWSVGTSRIMRASDDQFMGWIVQDVRGTDSAWVNKTGSPAMSLAADVQYYFEMRGSGGNAWRCRDIEINKVA